MHALAEAEVGEQLDEVEAADGGLVDEVLALAAAVKPARDRELGVVDGVPAPSSLSNRSSTSQKSAGPRFAAPAKRTSSGFSARSSLGLSEPAAQRIASATLDFPEPFGPTITPTPGSRRTSTVSGKDLKPRSLTARRCTGAQASLRPGWQVIVLGGRGGHKELARPDEALGAFELSERLLDLAPGIGLLGLVETGEHLVERPE